MSFTIAIVGRPNVGKSTLFNRLVGRRLALVDDLPGVTRDRREGQARLGDLDFTIIDTAGLEEADAESLAGRMLAQTKLAIEQADAVFFMLDAKTGPVPDDRAFADLVRRSGKPVIVVANKAEGKGSGARVLEAYELGLGDPVGISAEHGEGLVDLFEALREALPEATVQPVPAEATDHAADAVRPIRVAVVGRPNSGKSTLVNRLLGEDRMLTGPEAGLTRDTIEVQLEWKGRKFHLHDTAGLRRPPRIQEKLEKLSVADTINAIRFAEVVVLLMDAERLFEEQDLRIADLVEREGRALVIAISKWDLAERRAGGITKLHEQADERLPQVKGVPVVGVSGLTGEGVDRLMEAIVDIHEVWNKRVSTNQLNKWLEDVTAAHPPPAVSGRRIRLNYVTQAKARPPTFVLFCARAEKVPPAYQRYLVNALREHFDLPGTPIRLMLREKENPFADRKRKRQ
jgi:GTP-binding protein